MQIAIAHKAKNAGENSRLKSAAIYQTEIEGRFRRIGTQQLCLAWWLYREKHISRRQLRVFFAAHEMAERRRYTKDTGRKPNYTIHEVASLVGGKDSPTALGELTTDVRKLARLGLVMIEPRQIVFASSIEQLTGNFDEASFAAFLEQVPNIQRGVPVPRRMLRALAAGFSRAVTAMILALMIRSLFWHSNDNRFRVDGRTKGTWIADVFGVSRRAVSDARAHLVEIGWLQPLDASQWELNRWGNHDCISVEWSLQEGESASPNDDSQAESASPILNRKTSSTKNLKTISSTAVVSPNEGNRKTEEGRRVPRKKPPNIRDIEDADLRSTERLFSLYRQAIKLKLTQDVESALLDFLSLAERAAFKGTRAGALFFWLLKERKTEFISQADEDRATERLRKHLYGNGTGSREEPVPSYISDEIRYVWACIRTARVHRINDPFLIAREGRNWTRKQWDTCMIRVCARQSSQ